MKSVLITLFVILAAITAAAQDRFVVGVDYGRASLRPNFADPLHDVNAVGVSGLVRVAGPAKDGFKFRAGAEVRKTFNVEVFSDYGPMMMDIYRDPYTYNGVGELAYRFKFLELGARAKLGAEKLHENLEYRLTRAYEFRGTLVGGHFGVTPVIIGFEKKPNGFTQYFGAGVSGRF
jgi:hypothetical protein